MAFVFAPALWRTGSGSIGTTINGGQFLSLPFPVSSFPLTRAFKYSSPKAPLKDGSWGRWGFHKDVVPININGSVTRVSKDGDILLTEDEMMAAYEDLETFCDSPVANFEFFYYYDLSTTTYRKFKSVVVDSVTIQIGEDGSFTDGFGYTISMVAMDPTKYTTSPGV